MRILVTGAQGFIGKNLVAELKNRNYSDIAEFNKDTDLAVLDTYTKECDFVFHLAGVNRPYDDDEYMKGNFGLTVALIESLNRNGNQAPVLMASSIQATLQNPYGESKKAAENFLFAEQKETGRKVLVFRFPNIFGKWCRPHYNSAIATFCHCIACDLPITVHNRATILKLVYIDDVVQELIRAMNGKERYEGRFCIVPAVYTETIGDIAELISSFKKSREEHFVPDMSNELVKKLYSTYLSYIPKDKFSYPLKMNIDNRGSFTEFLKTTDRGQVSVNISKPGIVKGNHWHHSKNEKFLVVYGKGVIRFRQIGTEDIIEYHVSGERLEVVDIPVGFTHNIENTGESELITIMWANECFNPAMPDTYYLEV